MPLQVRLCKPLLSCLDLKHSHTERFHKLANVDDALDLFLGLVGKTHFKTESVPVREAFGRVLADDVVARFDIPSFDRSVVDGFAVRFVDLSAESKPIILKISGESRLGKICNLAVKEGQSIKVATGSFVPKGADVVLPVEDVIQSSRGRISFSGNASLGQNILRKGEDVVRGKIVLAKGRRLRPQEIGLLNATGSVKVSVVKKPRVAVISTGNELVEATRRIPPGRIVDINRVILSGMIREYGGHTVDLGIVRDHKVTIVRALKKAINSSDLVFVTGGSSVGRDDMVPSCINSLGKPGMLIHGIAMRPAMPTGLAVVNRVPIISAPGVPVSMMFAFLVFGQPCITKLGGTHLDALPINAKTSERLKGSMGFRTFVRVSLKRQGDELVVMPVKSQFSSVFMSVVEADGYVVIPENVAQIPPNQLVNVKLFR